MLCMYVVCYWYDYMYGHCMYVWDDLKYCFMCYGLNLVDIMFAMVAMYRWHDCGLSMYGYLCNIMVWLCMSMCMLCFGL